MNEIENGGDRITAPRPNQPAYLREDHYDAIESHHPEVQKSTASIIIKDIFLLIYDIDAFQLLT